MVARQVLGDNCQTMDFLHGPTNGPTRLRELLAAPGVITAPGCYDALSARLVEEAGFDCAYMTGFGTAAGLLGRPDVGLLTFSEMVDNVRRITQAIGIPLIADMDTGYGNQMNVIRSVQLYEQTGVAGFHLEDQVTPKKCGHMENKQVITAGEATAKIRAAVRARTNPDTVIIARTDARAMEGLRAAIDRAKAFRDAGADVLFVEALQGEGEIEQVAEELRGETLFFNWAEGGKTPPLPIERIRELGFKIVICPITTMLTATAAMRAALAEIRVAGTPLPLIDRLLGFAEFTSFIGLAEITALEHDLAE